MKPPAHRPEGIRARNLRLRYGITVDEYDGMLAAQGGVCKLCGGLPKGKRLHVDHCHKTLRVRGILCTSCNTTIGKLERIPGGLASIESYLVV